MGDAPTTPAAINLARHIVDGPNLFPEVSVVYFTMSEYAVSLNLYNVYEDSCLLVWCILLFVFIIYASLFVATPASLFHIHHRLSVSFVFNKHNCYEEY